MFRDSFTYNAYIVADNLLHQDQSERCAKYVRQAEERREEYKKWQRPSYAYRGTLWPANYVPTAEDVLDVKEAFQEGRAVPHQIVSLILTHASKLDHPHEFIGADFPRRIGLYQMHTPERFVRVMQPAEVYTLMLGGEDVLTSVWLERAALHKPTEQGKVAALWRQLVGGAEWPNKDSALRLLKKIPELAGPLPEIFNRHDEFYGAQRGTYRSLVNELGSEERAVTMMAAFAHAREQQKEDERLAAENGGVIARTIYRVKHWTPFICAGSGY